MVKDLVRFDLRALEAPFKCQIQVSLKSMGDAFALDFNLRNAVPGTVRDSGNGSFLHFGIVWATFSPLISILVIRGTPPSGAIVTAVFCTLLFKGSMPHFTA